MQIMMDTAPTLVAIIVFLVIVGGWELSRKRGKRRATRRSAVAQFRPGAKIAVRPQVATSQLDTVMGAAFQARPLMSRAEASVFYAAERAMKRLDIKGRVMAQVCLGEILRSPDDDAFHAINSKRVDILVISNSGWPLAAIEYQGEGHYQGTAYARDAVKKAALQRAGVAYLEVTPQHSADDIERDLARVMQAHMAPA
ncbi:DUF2726 domain-containing protein [Brevundimonas intermedia]|uniref:DUF2726 domain-containing protein n=1 Tax=Brevundimonas intermedia TaxID=74315 RepID=A0A4Y9S171_9CAUL|nr:DUF2726 domain-containing protein [Brevundimonas intermedia]TFW15247.1 DUF2726 domain-containing protein [Brevundimonas intermedia]